MQVHFLIHESFEAPGAYLDWAKEEGHEVSVTRLYLGEQLPSQLDELDFLIVMGGPQSPKTTLEECSYFDAAAEISLIQEFMAADKPVLGVCLGAQLLGEACGAPVETSPEKEIGHFPISLTAAGREDAYLQDFPDQLVVGHWHGDMPGLPESAQVLAQSDGCPRQIVRFGKQQYGFQCHLEFSPALLEGLIAQEDQLDQEAKSHLYFQDEETILAYDYQPMNAYLKTFLNRLVAHD